jgi:uncharacterized iron-regulated protein
MRFLLLFSLFMAFSLTLAAQQKPAYRLFDQGGKKLSYRKAMKSLQDSDVVLFGELHNNPIAHWLELEMLRDLAAGDRPVAVGAEMLETDQEALLQEYMSGIISRDSFEQQLRAWPNYKTDYRPVVEFCLERKIPLTATNVSRKYARLVFRNGLASLDSLPEEEKAWLAPLPFEIDYSLPSYKAMTEMGGGHGTMPNPENFVAAQALKDATMADRILRNFPGGGIFFHLNGSYHSDQKEGIAWYVKRNRPDLRICNLSVVEQSSLSALDPDSFGKADVIIVVPESMTKTY